tara:strand:- start:17095 stop:17778 length:684 start_codon:yes stop_codon:yes gene_type:complete
MESDKIIALLPMKGHSERVPNKNLRSFNGKPLYHAIVNKLLKSKYISNIVINTDSEAIRDDIQKYFGDIIIHDRPTEIIGDFVPMNEIINYDINKIDSYFFIQTHSTNPLLKTETIDNAIEFFLKNREKYDSLFSVTKLQTRLYWEDGKPLNHDPKKLLRTQDLPSLLEENSNFYIFSKDSFKNSNGTRIGVTPCLYQTNQKESLDIDTIEDFEIAEAIFKINQSKV